MAVILLLLALPLLEIATFVLVGGMIGVLPTIGLVLLGAVCGFLLLRSGGLGALARAQEELQAGRDPGPHLVQASMTVVSALLLIVPGFLTDVAGLLLLVPAVRSAAWRLLKRRIAGSASFTVFRGGYGAAGRQADQSAAPVIDLDADDFSRTPNPDSPWRLGRGD
ncbi:MAG: membrane protein FxsA [Rhizobiales bacterium]|nr:membrane protein FxsA [Hyphomicrobiales bacterium]